MRECLYVKQQPRPIRAGSTPSGRPGLSDVRLDGGVIETGLPLGVDGAEVLRARVGRPTLEASLCDTQACKLQATRTAGPLSAWY